MDTANTKVMVIGGGIAGLTAALELSKNGVQVDILEKTGFLGGHAISYCCKAGDECEKCGACSVEQTLKEVTENADIKIHLGSKIKSVKQNNGFSASINKDPVFIDPDKCTNCGQGMEVCPEEGAIARGYSKNNIPLFRIQAENCAHFTESNCTICQDICPENAIDLEKSPTKENLNSDSVVLASGFEPFNPNIKPTYGYGKFKNIITGLDLEQMLRVKGDVFRPSDNKKPDKIAFVQCVGSRDHRLGNLWCSKVCCPYSLRMARMIKRKNPEAQITIFYMDIQNTGKNFQAFYKDCREEMRFIRSIPVDFFPSDGDRIRTRFIGSQNSLPLEEFFDMAVLSVGITPGKDNEEFGKILGIDLDEDGFLDSREHLVTTATKNEGVFLAGTVQGPKNIHESIAHAGEAAKNTLDYLRGLNDNRK